MGWQQQVIDAILSLLDYQLWFQRFIREYEESPGRLCFELVIVVIIIWLLFIKESDDPNKRLKLSRKQEEEIITSWKPEPLVPIPPQTRMNDRIPVLQGGSDAVVRVDGSTMTNFASTNFLGLANSQEIKMACKQTIDKYGVGSCGPRGFYGSIDVHLELEKDIAAFYNVGESILYSDGIACVASVIPAFSKRGDLIICDEGVHYGIQQGIELSRSNILYFKHNDMDDLKRVLDEVKEKDRKFKAGKLNRRFIVVEGLYQYYGDIAPLKTLVQLKYDYKYRLIVDDSFALGVLGNTGRGSYEHAGIPIKDIDILCGTMDNSLSSVGGYCIGSNKTVVDHQRLSGAGYCFSASAPPYTSTASAVALSIIMRTPELTLKLSKKSSRLRRVLKKSLAEMGVIVGGDEISPVIHIRLQRSIGSRKDDSDLITRVGVLLRQHEIIVSVPHYVPWEKRSPPPSIRLFVTLLHTDVQMDRLARLLRDAFRDAMEEALLKVERDIRMGLSTAYVKMALTRSESRDKVNEGVISPRNINSNNSNGHSHSNGTSNSNSNGIGNNDKDKSKKKKKKKESKESKESKEEKEEEDSKDINLAHDNNNNSNNNTNDFENPLHTTPFFYDFPEYQPIAWLRPIVERARSQQQVAQLLEKKRIDEEREKKFIMLTSPLRNIFKVPFSGGAIKFGDEVWVYSADGSLSVSGGAFGKDHGHTSQNTSPVHHSHPHFHHHTNNKWFYDAITDGMCIRNLSPDQPFALYLQHNQTFQLRSYEGRQTETEGKKDTDRFYGQSLTKVWAVYSYDKDTHTFHSTTHPYSASPSSSSSSVSSIGLSMPSHTIKCQQQSSTIVSIQLNSNNNTSNKNNTHNHDTDSKQFPFLLEKPPQITGSIPPFVIVFAIVSSSFSTLIASWRNNVRLLNDRLLTECSRRKSIERQSPSSCPLCLQSDQFDLCLNCGFFSCKAIACQNKPFPSQCPSCLDISYRSVEPSEIWLLSLMDSLGLS